MIVNYYIQQKAGVSHQGIFQKIVNELSETHINETQLRRYTQIELAKIKGYI